MAQFFNLRSWTCNPRQAMRRFSKLCTCSWALIFIAVPENINTASESVHSTARRLLRNTMKSISCTNKSRMIVKSTVNQQIQDLLSKHPSACKKSKLCSILRRDNPETLILQTLCFWKTLCELLLYQLFPLVFPWQVAQVRKLYKYGISPLSQPCTAVDYFSFRKVHVVSGCTINT